MGVLFNDIKQLLQIANILIKKKTVYLKSKTPHKKMKLSI